MLTRKNRGEKMKKILKTILASILVLTLTVLSSCWLDAPERIQLVYDSVEEFVFDFGTRIEKKEVNDACCLFEYDAIKTSVEENLSCDIESEWCTAYVIASGGDLKPQRYEYTFFIYRYLLKKEGSFLGELFFQTIPKRCFEELKFDVIRSELIDGIKVDISFEVRRDGDRWHATVYIEEAIVNLITIRLVDNKLKNRFSEELFIDIIKPMIKRAYIIR